jgi:hypothetical protein
VEESRTNLLTYSEEFDDAAWNFAGCLAFGSGSTANAITAPDGTLTADLITQDSATSLHSANRTAAFAVTAGQTYTLSVFLKANGVEWVFLQLNGNIWTETGDRPRFWFNLSTGEEGSSDRNSGVGLTNFGDGWYRAHITATASTNANTNLAIAMTVADGNNSTFAGDGTSGIYLWGAQLEAGSFPTSYIPTEGSTVTRAADVASITGTNFSSWYEQSEGTAFVEAKNYPYPITGKALVPFAFSDNTYNNRITLAGSTGTNQFNFDVTKAGSFRRAILGNFVSSGLKVSGGYKSTGSAGSLDGAATVTSDTPNIPSVISQLNIGQGHVGTNILNGHIKRLTYWPTRLSNDTLQTITT